MSEQDLESIGGPKEVALYRACCYYYMQMFDKVIYTENDARTAREQASEEGGRASN